MTIDQELLKAIDTVAPDSDWIQSLLLQGANPDVTDELGRFPLMICVHFFSPRAARVLIHHGADMEQRHIAQGSYAETALMMAAFHGRREIVSALLDAGCNVNAKDCLGRTAWEYARRHADTSTSADIINLLEKRRAKDLQEIDGAGMRGVPASVLRDTPRLILKKKPGAKP